MRVIAGTFGEVLLVNDELTITVLNIDHERVELGFEAAQPLSIVSQSLQMNQQEQSTLPLGTKASASVFKPSSSAHLVFEKTVLNANVDWALMVTELLVNAVSHTDIAEYIGIGVESVGQVLQQDYTPLTFRAGARLVTLHCEHYPERYGF